MIELTPEKSALLLVDLQNDFLHPKGAYGRAGQSSRQISSLPKKIAPLADAMRDAGGWVVSTHFTLIPGRSGEPLISAHLKMLRPFLGRGDFAPGSWGHDLVDALKPADFRIEKVAYSAFFMTRLEWVLRKAGIDTLLITGIVTNGGVASTLRDAHVRDFHTILLTDGCGAFSRKVHNAATADLATISETATCEDAAVALGVK
ncbi:MAG: cysteine hydrolase family protein [Hyphomicrobiales bacterium]